MMTKPTNAIKSIVGINCSILLAKYAAMSSTPIIREGAIVSLPHARAYYVLFLLVHIELLRICGARVAQVPRSDEASLRYVVEVVLHNDRARMLTNRSDSNWPLINVDTVSLQECLITLLRVRHRGSLS